MTEKTVLVTAASRGIGRGIASRLTADGYRVINLDRAAPAALLPSESFIQVDLADRAATAAALAEAVERHAPTRLVNNAGVVRPASLEDVTLEDLEAVVSLNLRCAIQCAQAVLPAMKATRLGRIVNISSRAAIGKELRTVYAATKAGLIGMTKTWALELAAAGITVNAIGPGPIGTELFHAANPPDSPKTKAIIDGVPVKRLGTPDDIAHAAAFLLDDRAGFVTGQVLYVCGGMTVGLAS
jgi:NAD(P)-dependent dehydrogenase (short-subunit alcohol dehydrogenase family)